MRRPARLTTIAHADHRVMSPISDAKLADLLASIELPEGARVLDLCCGKAEVLFRLLEAQASATGLGVDRNATFLDDARGEARRRGLEDRVELVEGDVQEQPLEAYAFDVVVSIGGAYLGGHRRSYLAALRKLVRDGGHVLVGDVYHRRPPDPDELAKDGWPLDEAPTHADHVTTAMDAGLTPLYTTAASLDEWDAYEGRYLRAVVRWARAHPEDPEAEAMVRFAQWWHRRYLEWRRDVLGFGLYLFVR